MKRRFSKTYALRISLVLSIFSAACFSSAAQEATKSADKDLPNFAQVSERLYRGAQPTEAGIRKLAAMGVKTVVSLRGADEKAKKEELWARAAGLRYINLALDNWRGPSDAKIAEIEKTISAAENQPVFVHCKRGADRTGTVIAVYRMTHDGWDDRRALAEAEKYGFGWWQVWMKDYIRDYYRDLKK